MSSRRGSMCRERRRNLWRRKRLRVLPARKNRPEAALLVPVCSSSYLLGREDTTKKKTSSEEEFLLIVLAL